MPDEYNNGINEYNDDVSEFKTFEPIEYFNVNEVKSSPLEQQAYKEDSSEDTKTSKTIKEQIDEINNLSKTDVNEINNVNSSELNNVDLNVGASESTAANVVSTSTTLAGGITVLSAAAVVAGTMGGGIFLPKPDIKSCNIEVGADYLIYEIDIDKINSVANCIIRVSSGNFSIDFPIEEAGIQKQLVTGLIPLRTYTISVIGDFGVFKDNTYFETTCYTVTDQMPKALFEFNPVVDYDNYVFSLDYDIYFSNYYNLASNPSLEIYMEDELIIEDFTLDEENFFRGQLEDLSDMQEINARVYGDVNGERTLLSEYGYKTEYPDDFISYKNRFTSKYELKEENISYDYDIEVGNTLNIDTNFQKGYDKTDALRFDIYNGEELIKSVESEDGLLSTVIDPIYKEIRIVAVEIKKDGNLITEFDSNEIEYKFNSLFKDVYAQFYEGGFNFSATYDGEIIDPSFDIEITMNFIDGNSITQTDTFESLDYANEFQVTDEISSVSFVISHNGIKLYQNTLIPNKVELGTVDVSDDGALLIPYEIKALDGYEFSSAEVEFFDGTDITLSDLLSEGVLEIEEINKNLISGNIKITYKDIYGDEILIISEVRNDDLGAEIEVVSYVMHANSMIFYNLDFITTLNGKNINMDLDIITDRTVMNDGDYVIEESSIEEADNTDVKVGNFYSIRIPDDNYSESVNKYQIKYIVRTDGFDNSIVTASFASDVLNAYQNSNHDRNSFESNTNIYYFKRQSSNEGKALYYFDTGFKDNSTDGDGIYERIFYSYVVDGEVKYGYTPYFNTSTYELELDDRYEYNFSYSVMYYYNNYYYEDKVYYELKEIDESTLLQENSDVLYQDGDDTYIEFTLNYNMLTDGDDINISYDGKTYQIPIKSKTSPDVVLGADGDYYSYFEENSLYQYNVNVDCSDSLNQTITVALKLFDYEIVIDTVQVKVNYSLAKYYSNYSIEDEVEAKEVTLNLCEYSIDVTDLTYKFDQTKYDDEYYLEAEVENFNTDDRREKYRFEYYYNGELVLEIEDGYGQYLSPIYDKLQVKLIYYKMYDGYTLDYYTVDCGEIELEKKTYIDNVSLSFEEEAYSFSAIGVDGVEISQIKYFITTSDGTVTELTSEGSNVNGLEAYTNIEKLQFEIYFNNNGIDYLAGKYTYTKDDTNAITFGDYSINDEGVITLDYTNNTNDVTLISYNENEIVPVDSGSITIDAIDSNEIQFIITREYTDSYGNTASLSYIAKKVFEVEMVSDYYFATEYVSGVGFSDNTEVLKILPKTTILGQEVYLDGWEIVFSKCGNDGNPNTLSEKTVSKSLYYTTVVMYLEQDDSSNNIYEVEYHYVLPNGDIYDDNGKEFKISIQENDISTHQKSVGLVTSASNEYHVTRNQDGTVNLEFSEFREDSSIDLDPNEYYIVELRAEGGGLLRYTTSTPSLTIENLEDVEYSCYVYMMYNDGTNEFLLAKNEYNQLNVAVTTATSYKNSSNVYEAYYTIKGDFIESTDFKVTYNGEELNLTYVDTDLSGSIGEDGVTYELSKQYNDAFLLDFKNVTVGDVITLTITTGNTTGNYQEKTYTITVEE